MSHSDAVMLELRDVRFGFDRQPDFLGPVNLSVRAGSCCAIVGPNGAGKSTLLRLMAGLYTPTSGSVTVGGDRLERLSLRERARRIAFVPQSAPVDVDLSVRDLVLMGRYPHRTLGLFDSASDGRVVERAMARMQVDTLADRAFSTLSGGESQRVHVAAGLAQESRLLLLDEPTASLDLQHQLAIFQELRRCAKQDGVSVVVVTHDLNLAAQFAGQALLLHNGKCVRSGSPADVLSPEVLAPVYGVEMVSLTQPGFDDRRWVVAVGDTSGRRS